MEPPWKKHAHRQASSGRRNGSMSGGEDSGQRRATLVRSWSLGRRKNNQVASAPTPAELDERPEGPGAGDEEDGAVSRLKAAISNTSLHSTTSTKSSRFSGKVSSFGAMLTRAGKRGGEKKARRLKDIGRQSSLVLLPSQKARGDSNDEDDDAFHSPGILTTPSCSSGALNSAAVSVTNLARGDRPVPAEADLAALLPLPSSLPIRAKSAGHASGGTRSASSSRQQQATSSLRRHHRRDSSEGDAFRFPEAAAVRCHLDLHDDLEHSDPPSSAGVSRSHSDDAADEGDVGKPTVLRAHKYARHGAEIDIVPKSSAAAGFVGGAVAGGGGGDSPSIVPKQSPHTRRHHRIARQSSGSPRQSPKFQPRSPTMSRDSDNLLLPGEGDQMPASMCEADVLPAGSLRRMPSNQTDVLEPVQGSPSQGSNHLGPEFAVSGSPLHSESRGGVLHRKSSRGSTDSDVAKVATTSSGDGKGWLLGRKLSMGKNGRLAKKRNSRSLEDLSVTAEPPDMSLSLEKADADVDAEPENVIDMPGPVAAETLPQPASDKRHSKRLFGFANPRRWASGKSKKMDKNKNLDIQEYTFQPDPARSKLAQPSQNHTLEPAPLVMVTRSSTSSVDGQQDSELNMAPGWTLSSSVPTSPIENHLGEEPASNTGTTVPMTTAAVTNAPQAPAGPAWRGLLNMKKKMNPLDQLFEAIERQDFEAAEAIVTQTPNFDINETNAEDHTPLDVAVMTDAVAIAKLIMRHGGRENPIFIKNRYIRSVRLTTLVTEAEEQVEKLSANVVNLGGGGPNGVAGNAGNVSTNAPSSKLKESERQLRDWEWRYHTLRRMLQIYDRAKAPEAPKWVKLSVMSPTSLRVDFDEPEETNGAVVTRYKIVWSLFPEFTECNEFIKTDLQEMRHVIEDLEEDLTYYVYMEAFNMQGYSGQCYSTPSCATPSSWHTSVDDDKEHGQAVPDRCCTSQATIASLDSLAQSVLDQDTEDALDSRGLKRNWFKMFGGKFTHSLEPGALYLAVINYTEDNRVQLTADGHLPVLLVDLEYNAGQHSADIMWFSKVCRSWKDTRSLKAMIGSDQSNPTLAFRHRLLLAAIQAQLSFSQINLGSLHPEIINDFNRCTVLTVVKHVPKSQSAASGNRWVPISRFIRKKVNPERPNTPGNVEKPEQGIPVSASTTSIRSESSPPPLNQTMGAYTVLVSQLQDIISFNRNVRQVPPRGLYVGLLKLRTSLSNLTIFTSKAHPLMLPCVKVSDNPNVSRDEWLWLKRVMAQTQDSSVNPLPDEVTQHGRTFQQRIARSAARLLTRYNLDDGEEDVMDNYYLYCREVIEVSEDVSMVLLLPAPDALCLPPKQQSILDENDEVVTLPLHYYELAQKVMFSSHFGDLYTRVSSVLDCRSLCSKQVSRQAFTKEESLACSVEEEEVIRLQSELNSVWDRMRWVRDIVQLGKEKLPSCTVPLRRMFTAGVGISNAHALPSFARRGPRVNNRRSLQHTSWSSNSIKLQQQQHLLLQQAKRQRSHLQRRASLETTEIFNDIDKAAVTGGGGNQTDGTAAATASPTAAASAASRDERPELAAGAHHQHQHHHRQGTLPSSRRASLPGMNTGGPGSFSTLPRSSRRSSSTAAMVIEERSEQHCGTPPTVVAANASHRASTVTVTADDARVLSDPNIVRRQSDMELLPAASSHFYPTTAMATSPTTDAPSAGRSSPVPPQRSSSRVAMTVHRLSRTGSPGQYSDSEQQQQQHHRRQQLPPYTLGRMCSTSPDGTLVRHRALSPENSSSSGDGRGRSAGAVGAAVHALEGGGDHTSPYHNHGRGQSSDSVTPSPDRERDGRQLAYTSSSYTGSTSSSRSQSSSSRSSSNHASSRSHGAAMPTRSLSPSSSGSASPVRSVGGGGHVGTSAESFGTGNIASAVYHQPYANSTATTQHRSSTLPATGQPWKQQQQQQQQQQHTATLAASGDASAAAFRRTPPLRRKNASSSVTDMAEAGHPGVTRTAAGFPADSSQAPGYQQQGLPPAHAIRGQGHGYPTTTQHADGDFSRFGARKPSQLPVYNGVRSQQLSDAQHVDAARPSSGGSMPRRSVSDTSFAGLQAPQPPAGARVMRSQATQSHLNRRMNLEGADSGSEHGSPTIGSPLRSGISTTGDNWVRVFPFFASQLLAKGTNIKLQINRLTTCREVIHLVVKEVKRLTQGSARAQAQILDVTAYCLVSKVDGRDCPLPDDFKPLELSSDDSRRQMYIRERSKAEQMLQQGQSTSV